MGDMQFTGTQEEWEAFVLLNKQNNMALDEIRQLAEKAWEGCHGCDEYDKQMWINGFVTGYLNSKSED